MRWFGWFRRRKPATGTMLDTMALQEGTPVGWVAGRMRTMGVPYALPRDLEEINRLDFQHYMLRFALQGLYAAPIGAPLSILDVGTAPGAMRLRWRRCSPGPMSSAWM